MSMPGIQGQGRAGSVRQTRVSPVLSAPTSVCHCRRATFASLAAADRAAPALSWTWIPTQKSEMTIARAPTISASSRQGDKRGRKSDQLKSCIERSRNLQRVMVPRGGRSRPSVAFATPVHPCTMEPNHRHEDFQSRRFNSKWLKYLANSLSEYHQAH